MYIILCFCFVFLHLVYYLLLFTMDCPFVIVHSMFSNVYLIHASDFPCTLCLLCAPNFVVLLKRCNYFSCNVGIRKCDVIQIKTHISDVMVALLSECGKWYYGSWSGQIRVEIVSMGVWCLTPLPTISLLYRGG